MRTASIIKVSLLIVVLVLLALWLLDKNYGEKDFEAFLKAPKYLFDKQDIYAAPETSKYYSPFFALVLVPFAFLGKAPANLLWIFLNYLFIYRIWRVAKYFLDTDILTTPQRTVLKFLPFVFTAGFILSVLDMGQVNLFMLWGSLESIRLIHEHKTVRGSALLGSLAAIKIFPICLLPYLVYRRAWRAAALAGFALLFALFLPGVLFGFKYNWMLLGGWVRALGAETARFEFATGPHDLAAFVPSLFMDVPSTVASYRRHIAILSEETVWLILNGARLSLILLTLKVLNSLPFRSVTDKCRVLYEVGYILLITPLLFPHQQKYAFVYLVPACFYLVYSYSRGGIGKPAFVAFIAAATLFPLISPDLIGSSGFAFAQHFRVITWATLLIIGVYVGAKPSQVLQQ